MANGSSELESDQMAKLFVQYLSIYKQQKFAQ